MAKQKGVSTPNHKAEQRAELVEAICAMYETQHVTIESCCEAAGISARTFTAWVSKNSDFSERYKKAKTIQDENYWEGIIKPLAKTALQRHLEAQIAEEEKDVVFEGVKTGETQKTVKQILPNASVTIFALKGLYPDKFAERHEHTGKDGGPVQIKQVVIEIPSGSEQPGE